MHAKTYIDHPLLACVYSVHDNSSYDILFREPAVFQAAMDQWNANHTGPGAASVFNQVGFFRLPDNATIFETTPDPASGPKSGHFEIMFSVSNYPVGDAAATGPNCLMVEFLQPPWLGRSDVRNDHKFRRCSYPGYISYAAFPWLTPQLLLTVNVQADLWNSRLPIHLPLLRSTQLTCKASLIYSRCSKP